MRESRDSVEFALNWLNCVLRGQTIGAQDRLPGRCRRILDLVVLMCRNISVEARRRKSHSAADSTNDRSGAGVGCSKGEGKRCEGIKKKLRYEIKQSASRIKKPNGHQEAREQEHGQTEGCILEGRRLEGPKELAGESVEEIRLSADRAKLALREKKKKSGGSTVSLFHWSFLPWRAQEFYWLTCPAAEARPASSCSSGRKCRTPALVSSATKTDEC